ncbi:GNAT family N-acetyltransferase [Nocardia sp. NBC_01503]|uniref:GNAT family N-acetyltransferase n=1 Tax=Nocardia sp. NBC_01503 TaxID=2975997 RepID=UPI002E7ACCF8|nr:GNAT family N-acetyltransferase [Nocardia sp. NBC_01503]WTL31129.1 GNAT family N-acetyltransferase [Nocardia sp. NBC_01503]
MYSQHFTFETGAPAAVITRVSDTEWHAEVDGRVVGNGDVTRRPDGRLFVSVDAWHATVFDQLADAMRAELSRPLYTVVDEVETDLIASWRRAGFTRGRREWEYSVPTDPEVTGLDTTAAPGITIVAAGTAAEDPLRELDRVIRAEVEATVGWHNMPAEVLCRGDGDTIVDPSKYAVAMRRGRYVGLIRVVRATRRPRIGLIAVRAEEQRAGVARALLAHALDRLHRDGIGPAYAEVNESNTAATALFDGIGAQRVGGNLELVLP